MMQRVLALLICLAGLVLTVGVAKSGLADEIPTADQLVKLGPVISNSDDKIHTAELAGAVELPNVVHLTFLFLYKAPKQVYLVVRDGRDGTPLFLFSNEIMLMYDPVASTLLTASDGTLVLRLKQEPTQLTYTINMTNKEEEKTSFSFDLRSILNRRGRTEDVKRVNDKEYELTQVTEKGNKLISRLNPSATYPCTRMEIRMKDSPRPIFSLERIIVNGSLVDDQLKLPTKEALAKKVKVADFPGDSELAALTGVLRILRTAYVRFPSGEPHPGGA